MSGTVIAPCRLFLTADKDRVVADGDLDAAFLLVGAGLPVPDEWVDKLPADLPEPPAPDPDPEPEATVPEPPRLTRRLYLADDKVTVVEEGDQRAAFLLAGVGALVPAGFDIPADATTATAEPEKVEGEATAKPAGRTRIKG